MMKALYSVVLVIILLLNLPIVYAGNTVLTFDNQVTSEVIPSGETNPTDGFAIFSGVYEEGDFRVRPNGGVWYVAGDLGDAVNHFYSITMPGWAQYLAVQRISGRNALIGGEFLVKSLVVQSTANESLTLDVVGQNEDGQIIWQYWVQIPAGTTPVLVRLDTQIAVRGTFLTPVNRVAIGTLGGAGVRVLELSVEPAKASGGRKGR